MVSSLFTVCRPEHAMLGPTRAVDILSCAPCTSNLIYADNILF